MYVRKLEGANAGVERQGFPNKMSRQKTELCLRTQPVAKELTAPKSIYFSIEPTEAYIVQSCLGCVPGIG
jgi:hypothetical protein